MFPRAHKILFVIICNGWFAKDLIQTGVSDYIDYRQDAQSQDYTNTNLYDLHNEFPNSKLPPPKQKETLGEFTKRINKNSKEAKPSPKANPRIMVNPSEQISTNSLPANPSSKANPRSIVNPSEQISGNLNQANMSPKLLSKGNHQKISNVKSQMFCLIIFIRDLKFT